MSLFVWGISKDFYIEGKKLPAVENVSFEVEKGQFCSLVGPSGCGKSTILRIIMGLEKSNSGDVRFEGKVIKPGAGLAAMVFQHFALFPWMTVYENIEFGLKMQEVIKVERRKIVEALVEEVGLSGFSDKHPKELSGGMKQRVGIARALSLSPQLLLMDEPFGALDAFTAGTLRRDLLRLWYKHKMTVVMVTHLVEEAAEMSDKIIVFTPRPGKVEKIVENSLKRPRNKRTGQFYKMVDSLTDLVKV